MFTRIPSFALLAVVATAALAPPALAVPMYAWRAGEERASTLADRIAPPAGFERAPAEPASLRRVAARPSHEAGGTPGLTYTGAPKWRQDVHVAVVDIDVGKRDLQQCADAIMRLRAEWLFASRPRKPRSPSTTPTATRALLPLGKRRTAVLLRQVVENLSQGRRHAPACRHYMDLVFAYAGTYSLERELKPVAPTARYRHRRRLHQRRFSRARRARCRHGGK